MSLRVVFMGTPEFSVGIMQRFASSDHKIVGAVTVADKPAGRGQQLRESAVKKYCSEHGIPVLQPLKLKDQTFLDELNAFEADVFVVVAFRMLPAEVWKMPKLGTFNLHASLLPDYRGAAPINWTIINGDSETGVTTFMIDEAIDTGNILDQVNMPIAPDENAGSLHDRMMITGGNLVVKTLDGLEKSAIQPIPQSELKSALRPAPKLTRENTSIDWNADVRTIYNLIRGLSPYPGAWTVWQNAKGEDKLVKIYGARVQETNGHEFVNQFEPGTDAIRISCVGGELEVFDFQVEGKKRMLYSEWKKGHTADEWSISPKCL